MHVTHLGSGPCPVASLVDDSPSAPAPSPSTALPLPETLDSAELGDPHSVLSVAPATSPPVPTHVHLSPFLRSCTSCLAPGPLVWAETPASQPGVPPAGSIPSLTGDLESEPLSLDHQPSPKRLRHTESLHPHQHLQNFTVALTPSRSLHITSF